MATRSIGLYSGMIAALVAVLLLTYLDLRREQSHALDDFIAEQSAAAHSSALVVNQRIAQLYRDLGMLAAAREPALAFRDLVREQRAIVAAFVAQNGQLVALDDNRYEKEAAQTIALAEPEGVALSPPLAGAGDLRCVALKQREKIVAVLFHSNDLFSGLFAKESIAPQRIVVVDDGGRWLAGDGSGWRSDRSSTPEVDALLDRMKSGEDGTAILNRPAAAKLGLGERMAIAGFASVDAGPRQRWSIAVVTSARRVRDRARFAMWRVAIATSLAVLLVAGFGFALRRHERREARLREALRVAEATADLERNLIRAEKLATIGTLAAGIAHEVGTPLGIISGRAEQLLTKIPDGDASMKKGIDSILAQVDKVSSTIRQLLDFSRVRSVEAGAVSAAQSLGAVRALLEHHFRKAKVGITIDAPPSLPALRADPGQLEQVLVNLLMNACDACKPGGTVRARANEENGKIEIAISDDGHGIAKENLPLVLDPFFTTKKRGQGTGLGLSIVADIVKNHGGTIDIESAEGSGTTVRVLFPIAATAEVRAES